MKLKVLELKPTQFAVGMREVEKRAAKLRGHSGSTRHDYLQGHPVPVVVAAGARYYMVDRHHLARACWELGIEEVHAEIRADLSKHAPADFWDVMGKSHWSRLYDQFGKGPHDPLLLPENVRGLADDRYRSLAWEVRRQGGFAKSEELFAEFKWAEYFRPKVAVGPGDSGFEAALKEAMALCHRPECRRLPGFIPL